MHSHPAQRLQPLQPSVKLFTICIVPVPDLGPTPPPQSIANSTRPKGQGCRAGASRGSSPAGHPPTTTSSLLPTAAQPTMLSDAGPPLPNSLAPDPQKRQLSRLKDSSRHAQLPPSVPDWAQPLDQRAEAGSGQSQAAHAGDKGGCCGAMGEHGALDVQAARMEAAQKLPAPAKPKLRLPAVPRLSPPVPAGGPF